MRVKLICIGNSRGIVFPRWLLKQCKPGDELELEVRGESVVVRPVRSVRDGWEESFKLMRQRGDDAVIDEEAVGCETEWDESEWTWH